MPSPVTEEISRTIETLYRSESGWILATLVRLLGDLDFAEEAMHEIFAAALESPLLVDFLWAAQAGDPGGERLRHQTRAGPNAGRT